MKTNLLRFVLVLSAALAIGAAPATHRGEPWRQQVEIKFAAATGVVVQWRVVTLFQEQGETGRPRQLGTSTVDCVKDAAKTVKFLHGGKDYEMSYGALAEGMRTAALQEWRMHPQERHQAAREALGNVERK
jgi:hypothetical protein